MTEHAGTLTDRVTSILTREGAIVAGLLIDENTSSVFSEANAAQKRMLEQLSSWYCPNIIVELNPSLMHADTARHVDTKPTMDTLRTAAGEWKYTVVKAYSNALIQTDLLQRLKNLNITYVVVMGRETNCCVQATARGHVRETGGHSGAKGLVQEGFTVLTSQEIVRTTAPGKDFLEEVGVEWYKTA